MSTTLNDPAQRDANMDDAPQSDITTINMGPQHPSTHGVLRLVLKLEGESVLQVTPEIGYLHTGIEKTAEFKTYQQALTLTDRMDYLAPLSNNLGYSLAVEKLLDIQVPPRAEVARVLLVELQRIASHLVWLGSSAIDLGALSVFLYAFQDREQILDIFELTSGVRMMTSYIMPGGLTADLPPGFEDKVRAFLDYFPKRLAEYHNLLSGNEIWLERTRGLCYLDAATARQYSVTGPALRAAGVDWDLRRDMPYSGYETYDFAVPVAQEGDVYARYSVRMREMAESLKIVTQALERLPGGRWQVEDPKIVPPPKYEIAASMEALIHHFKLYTAGFRPPVGEVYQRIESPRGELGFYLVSDGGARPYRMRVRGPSFTNVQVLSVMLRGGLLADVVAGIASMDFILGEVDR